MFASTVTAEPVEDRPLSKDGLGELPPLGDLDVLLLVQLRVEEVAVLVVADPLVVLGGIEGVAGDGHGWALLHLDDADELEPGITRLVEVGDVLHFVEIAETEDLAGGIGVSGSKSPSRA